MSLKKKLNDIIIPFFFPAGNFFFWLFIYLYIYLLLLSFYFFTSHCFLLLRQVPFTSQPLATVWCCCCCWFSFCFRSIVCTLCGKNESSRTNIKQHKDHFFLCFEKSKVLDFSFQIIWICISKGKKL